MRARVIVHSLGEMHPYKVHKHMVDRKADNFHLFSSWIGYSGGTQVTKVPIPSWLPVPFLY